MDEKTIKRNLNKLKIIFTAICFVVLFISNIMSASIDRMYNSVVDEQLLEQADQCIRLLEKKIDGELKTLKTLAGFLDFKDEQETGNFIDAVYSSSIYTDVLTIGYFKPNGTGVTIKSNGNIEDKITMSSLPSEAQEVVERAWWGQSSVSKVHFKSEYGCNAITYAVPIYYNNIIAGVLFSSVDVETYINIIKNIQLISDNGIIAIANSDGDILMATIPYKTIGEFSIYDIDLLDNDSASEIAGYLKSEKTNYMKFLSDDEVYHACATPLGDIYDFSLLVIDTEENVSPLLKTSMKVTQYSGILIFVVAVIFVLFAIRQIGRNNQNLLNLAYRDKLTGAYNKVKFNQMIKSEWSDDVTSYVVAINIRQFKFINEIFGVEQSDRLLKHIANIIANQQKQGEFFCRDTADAFFIWLNEDEPQNVLKRLDSIFKEVDIIVEKMHSGYSVNFYCGTACTKDCIQEDGKETELMTHVMFALDRSKKSTQDRILFYDTDMHKKEQLQNYVESHMHQALENGEFKMYLQPKIDLKALKLGGAEALVRWITDGKQIIYPDQFIPIFEQNTFCVELDLYMVDEACKQMRSWIDEGLQVVPISVNQTKLLFYEEDYLEKLLEITSKYQIDPKMITLEILEGLALENAEQVNSSIERLRKAGFRISMDDFGSGYSSLNTLGNIQIDELKLDRHFLLSIEQEEFANQRTILELVIKMAKKLKISIVAEGVETEENEQMMREMDCDYGQGYYYSRPIPVHEFCKEFLEPYSKGLV